MDLNRIESFQDAVVTVMGLGRYKQGSGLGATKWLMRHGAQVIVTDLKGEEELEESMAIVNDWYEKYRDLYPDRAIYQPLFVLGEHRKEDFANVNLIVKNPGVPSESEYIEEAAKNNIPVESDVSLFFRHCPYPMICVTGTKGKTTTTKLVGEMLRKVDVNAVIAGNINTSPLEYLDDLLERGEPTPIVLELSSWLLESMPPAFKDLKKGPDVSVLTNIYPDHLDRYHSFGDYIHSKEIIFEHQAPHQFTVLNYDHPIVKEMEGEVKGQLFWCSRDMQEHQGCYIKDGNIVFVRNGNEEVLLPLEEVSLKGAHNEENILTAVCAAKLYNVPSEPIIDALKAFAGVPDRQELVREVDEITYINDTAATQQDAVLAALNRFGADGDIILIAGGVDKEGEYDALVERALDTCKHIVLFEGSASDLIAEKIAGRIPLDTGVKDMQDAVNKARAAASTGDIVLLSPAAASFNLFANAYDRGEQFREAVRNL